MMEIKRNRCDWCGNDTLYINYHDNEWGKLVTGDLVLFEFLLLESAQAGLSWITILKRRENYRKAFAGFDPSVIALFTEEDIEKLMQNQGIIRNRKKIESTITNAKYFLTIQKEYGSFFNYLRSFFPGEFPVINSWKSINEIPAFTSISDAISKDMKKKGFKFFGSTICYAYLQAVGFVNDHLIDCGFRNV